MWDETSFWNFRYEIFRSAVVSIVFLLLNMAYFPKDYIFGYFEEQWIIEDENKW